MNERVRELARRVVGKNKNDVGSISLFDEQIEQFAELIVRECANFAYKYTSNQKNVREYHEVGWDCLPGDLLDAMQEHFGVKE